jgi:glycosyltransferase involved in cell wall biosynthesis
MRILVDGMHMVPEMKGVGRYVANTLQHLARLDSSFHFSVLVFQGTPRGVLPQCANIEYVYVPCLNNLSHWLFTLPAWVRRVDPDIVWVPYEMPFNLSSYPYVMVCHDVREEMRGAQRAHSTQRRSFKEQFRDWIDQKFMGKTLRGARIVFSNSHYVGNWLKVEVKVNPSQIRFAPCAPGADFQRLRQDVDIESVRRRLGAPDGYVLTFQTGDLRENFSVVPKVYQLILDAGFPEALVIGGVRDHARAHVKSSFGKLPWCDRVRIVPFMGVDRVQELAELYAGASVYLDPSLHEGFGMQVIEAMACGIPVVCSNRGALPEVAGDAALLVDPEDSEEMASAVIRILEDQTFSDQIKEQGYKRATCFSWERTAKVIYEGLLDVQKTAKRNLHIPQQEENGDRVHACTPQSLAQPF